MEASGSIPWWLLLCFLRWNPGIVMGHLSWVSLDVILRENTDLLTTTSSKHRVPLYIWAGYCVSEAKTPFFSWFEFNFPPVLSWPAFPLRFPSVASCGQRFCASFPPHPAIPSCPSSPFPAQSLPLSQPALLPQGAACPCLLFKNKTQTPHTRSSKKN